MLDSIWGNIFKDRLPPDEAAADILRRVPVFEDLGPRDLDLLMDTMHLREYSAGETIFSQGVPGFGMYIILSGSVEIVYEPTGQTIARLGEGEFFGELALLVSSTRSAAAIAHDPCRLYGLFHSDLNSLIKRRPKMGNKIILKLASVIGERLKVANEQVLQLQQEIESLKGENAKD